MQLGEREVYLAVKHAAPGGHDGIRCVAAASALETAAEELRNAADIGNEFRRKRAESLAVNAGYAVSAVILHDYHRVGAASPPHVEAGRNVHDLVAAAVYYP